MFSPPPSSQPPHLSHPSIMHAQGYWDGGSEDGTVSMALHQRAADQGNVNALLSVGDSLYYGRGAPRDWKRAAEVYTAASKLRSTQVRRSLPPCALCEIKISGRCKGCRVHLGWRVFGMGLRHQPLIRCVQTASNDIVFLPRVRINSHAWCAFNVFISCRL